VHREGDEKSVHTVRIDDVLIGRYALKSRLGEGGMGAVYLAHDKELDREVAVKLLAANLVNDAEVVERFEREARLTAKLDHPNIVPVYDVGRHQGRPFIVMKKLEGATLALLLREKGGLTADETLKLLRQLAAGLDYLHQKGFIHRDIKAGNIFVGPDGHGTLLDFGIVRPNQGEGKTKTGVVMGTPHYMAPEQAIGSRDVDHRVDLYALAVCLFECLTGTLPFDADSELRLIQLQAHAPPPDLLERAPWIPKPVAEVMKRALAKRPQDRFSSAAELVKALEGAYAQARTVSVPQAVAVQQAPGQYKGPPQPPGTAPSWRKRGADDVHGENGNAPSLSPSAEPLPMPPLPGEAVPPAPSPSPAPPAPLRAVPERRPGRPVFFAVSGLALATAAALFVARPWGDPRIPVVTGETFDAGAPALAAIGLPDASIAAAEVDAGVPHVVQNVVLAPVDAGMRIAVSVPFQPRRGSVNVISTHDGEMFWSQVFVDGVDKGRTPLMLDLMPGKYQLRVERHGFKPQEREIIVASGKSIVVRIDLAP
jgi:serine/threonine-protein kinase